MKIIKIIGIVIVLLFILGWVFLTWFTKPVLISSSEELSIGKWKLKCALFSTSAMGGFELLYVNGKPAMKFDQSENLYIENRDNQILVYSTWKPIKTWHKNAAFLRDTTFTDISFLNSKNGAIVRMPCK